MQNKNWWTHLLMGKGEARIRKRTNKDKKALMSFKWSKVICGGRLPALPLVHVKSKTFNYER